MTTQDCSGCGATPCDCDQDIWGYWHEVTKREGVIWWARAATRSKALDDRYNCHKAYPNIRRSPVQRKTEPNPFEKKAESALFGVWVIGTAHPDGEWCHIDCGLRYGDLARVRAVHKELSDLYPDQTYEVRPYTKTPTGFVHVSSGAIDTSKETEPHLTEERLARLLFETDADVREAIDIADDREGCSYLRTREGPYAIGNAELLERAWLRNEGKRRMWAETVAAKVFVRARHEAKKP